jgi:leucyl-tRNA synthetase
MILVNGLYDFKNKNQAWPLSAVDLGLLIRLIEPFAPHLAEELWEQIGHTDLLINEPWPQFNEELIKDESFTLAIQVNGKVRSTLEIAADSSEEDIKNAALQDENVKKWVDGKEIIKIVYVKGKLLSIVIK